MTLRQAASSKPAALFPGKSRFGRGAVDDSLTYVDASSNSADERVHSSPVRILKPRSAHKLRQRLGENDGCFEWKPLTLPGEARPQSLESALMAR
jgi:hypothetical protein